jgi:hypothetical protein
MGMGGQAAMRRYEEGRRRYGEKEIRQILGRAAEIQAREEQAHALTAAAGLSLEELQQMAAEVGIEPRHVAAAAGELAASAGGGISRLWGAPSTYENERLVSAPLNEADWPAMVAEIRRLFGRPGTVSALGSSLEWLDETGAQVTLRPEGAKTRVAVALRNGEILFTAHLLAFIFSALAGIAIAASLDLSLIPGLSTFAGITLGGMAMTRELCRASFGRRERAVEELFGRLAEVATSSEAGRREKATASRSPGMIEVGAPEREIKRE